MASPPHPLQNCHVMYVIYRLQIIQYNCPQYSILYLQIIWPEILMRCLEVILAQTFFLFHPYRSTLFSPMSLCSPHLYLQSGFPSLLPVAFATCSCTWLFPILHCFCSPTSTPPISAPWCNSYLPRTDCFSTSSLHNNDSNVFTMVATKQLNESQLRSLETVERVASCFSLIGAIFIFITFVVSSNFRRPVNRLIFNASWGNTLGNIATLVSLSGPRAGQISHLCQFQAFLIQM